MTVFPCSKNCDKNDTDKYIKAYTKIEKIMSTLTVRISNTSRNILRELAAQKGASMQTLLDKAIEAYRRQLFLEEINQAYAALREDPKAEAQVEKDRAVWDATLKDGLTTNEDWTASGEVVRKKRRKQRG